MVYEFLEVTTPILESQAMEICSPADYPSIRDELHCSRPAGAPTTSCLEDCKAMSAKLEENGGCPFLESLCQDTAFQGGNEPHVIEIGRRYMLMVIVGFSIGIAVFALTSMCVCGLLYTSVSGLKGKKGVHTMCLKMFCPCCEETAHRRFDNLNEEESVDTSSDDER